MASGSTCSPSTAQQALHSGCRLGLVGPWGPLPAPLALIGRDGCGWPSPACPKKRGCRSTLAPMQSAYPPSAAHQLFAAATAGDADGVAALLRAGTEPNTTDPATGWSALASALIAGHSRVAEALVDAGADVRHVDRKGNGVLHACAAGAAAMDGDEVGLAVVRKILERDPSADALGASNHEGVGPLHLAAQRGKRQVPRRTQGKAALVPWPPQPSLRTSHAASSPLTLPLNARFHLAPWLVARARAVTGAPR
jgi:hypothetical protein